MPSNGGSERFQVDEAEKSPMLQEQRADQHLGVTASPNDNHWQVQGVLLVALLQMFPMKHLVGGNVDASRRPRT